MKTCSMTGLAATADAPMPSIVGRHQPPAEQLLALLADDPLDQRRGPARARPSSRGRNTQPGAVLAGRRQRDAERRGDLAEKPVRRLDQDAGAVAGVRLAAAGAAVQQVDEDLQPLLDDAVRAAALDVDDEPDAAGVVLVARVVQARRFGRRGNGELVIRHGW